VKAGRRILPVVLIVALVLAAMPMLEGIRATGLQPGLGLPGYYDLSTQPYFPTIGTQLNGDCAAWAITYYAFGYEEARKNGWTDASAGTDPAHPMSPSWTYDRANYGGSSTMSGNGAIIVNLGCASEATMPYSENITFLGSPAAYADAADHKASSCRELGYNSSTVTWIKSMIAANIPVTFALDSQGFRGLSSNGGNDNEIVLSEYNYTTVNHAGCIVGYNDTMTAVGAPDIGAFKVANSWGKTNGGIDGFYWISYDTVNFIGAQGYLMPTYILDSGTMMPTPTPTITSTPADSGTQDGLYQYHAASDINVTWSMSTNADWLAINAVTGTIFGTPTSGGTFQVTITATSTIYGTTATQSFSITIAPATDDGGGSTDGGGGSTYDGGSTASTHGGGGSSGLSLSGSSITTTPGSSRLFIIGAVCAIIVTIVLAIALNNGGGKKRRRRR